MHKREVSPFKSPDGQISKKNLSSDAKRQLTKCLTFAMPDGTREPSLTNSEIMNRLILAANDDALVQCLLHNFEGVRCRLLTCLGKLGYTEYRTPFQEAAAISVSSGQRPTTVRLPTGSGKSATYVLPAFTNYQDLMKDPEDTELPPFVTIVVCPLTALSRDQARSTLKLTRLDHNAVVAINGDSTPSDRSALLKRMTIRDPSLFAVYCTPSYLVANPEFQAAIVTTRPYMMVIEEAHTMKNWRSFVTAMLHAIRAIRLVVDSMQSKRLVLLTATMDDTPLDELLHELGHSMYAANNIRSPQVRPNVNLVAGFHASSVARDRWDHIARWILKFHPNDMVVVYMQTPREVESAYNSLKKKFACVYYHGQMSPEGRSSMNDLIDMEMFQVIVATVAYGLGIDKDFRGVYIGGGPGSTTAAIQLSGRAGRDLSSRADCYFSLNPVVLFQSYCLYWGDFNQLSAYSSYLRTVLNAETCLQSALGLWDYDICGSYSCETRCDVCLGITNIYQVDIAGAAAAVVGDGGATSLGLFSNAVEPELSFNDVIRTWALIRSLNDGREVLDNPDMPSSLLPTVLLLLCAYEFLVVSVTKAQGKDRHDLSLKPASPGLIARLFNEVGVGLFSVRGPRLCSSS